jgi:hypothetical protein
VQRDEAAPRGGPPAGRMLDRLMQLDANSDGKIQKDEVPERMQRLFERADLNHDNELDADELKAMSERAPGGPSGGRRRGAPGAERPARDAESPEQEIESPPDGDPPPLMRQNDGGGTLTGDEAAQPVERAAIEEPKQEQPDAPPSPATLEPQPTAPPAGVEDPPAALSPQEDPLSGHWLVERIGEDIPEDRREITFLLKLAADGTVTGSMKSVRNTGDISNGRFDAKTGALTFTFEAGQFPLAINADVREGKMTGQGEVGEGMFTYEFQGRRTRMLAEGESVAAPESNEPKEEVDPDARPLQEQLPGPRWVSSIEPSRYADGRVFLTLDAHRSNDDAPYVFVSQNYGQTWRSIRANLPKSAGTTRVIREDIQNANVLYLGTEFGAWVSIDRGKNWTKLNNNLPTVAVHEFAQHPTTGEIVAATHGRSLWVLDVSPLRQLSADALKGAARLYKPSTAYHWRPDPRRGGEGRRYVGENPASGAQLYYSLPEGAEQITLKITGPTGETLRELQASADPGLHRVTWDLRRTPNDRPPRRPRGEAGSAQAGAAQRAPESGHSQGALTEFARARRAASPGPAGAERAGQRGPRGGFGRRGQLVEPGKYVVTLNVDGQILNQTVAVETDPEHPDYRAWEREQEHEQDFQEPEEEERSEPFTDEL